MDRNDTPVSRTAKTNHTISQMRQQVNNGMRNTNPDDIVLEIRDVNVHYERSRGRAQVVNGVSIDVGRGETLGIAGESGSGKSMFASAILNAIRGQGVTTGEITFYPNTGKSVDILSLDTTRLKQLRWRKIAMVYQGAMGGFNPVLKIRTHFTETFDAHGINKRDGLAEAREIIRGMDLQPDRILDSYPNELSGGQKQRAMLALSLVFDPEVLILDEPTAGLDVIMRRNLLRTLLEIKNTYDMTMIFISHDVRILASIADRLAIMYAFEVIETGSIEDVLLHPEHPYTRMMLRAGLDLDRPPEAATPVDGDTPDPINIPSGCSYHPRCPIADERCEIEEPELRSAEDGDHEVACFYHRESVETIPVPEYISRKSKD